MNESLRNSSVQQSINSDPRQAVTGARGYPTIPVMSWEDCTKDTGQGEGKLAATPTFNS